MTVLEQWDVRKQQIMNRFAVQGNITVNAHSFDVVGRAKRGCAESEVGNAVSPVCLLTRLCRSLSRLEQLQDPDKGSREESLILTQEEFVTQLREMNEDIAHAWLSCERVTALKLATRVARLLTDTSVPSFYPTLFVLVTEVMDTMGRLVFDRIRNKAEREDDGTFVCVLPPGFTSADIRQDAKDTCVNWFYKIGAIRDLLPRIYMETALLKCYHFLQPGPPSPQVARLIAMIRGLGDPLAAAYARCFLARRAAALLRGDSALLEQLLAELLTSYTAIASNPGAYAAANDASLGEGDYIALMEPPLEWMLGRLCVCGQQDSQLLARLLDAAGPSPPLAYVSVLLNALPSGFVALHSRQVLGIIKNAGDAQVAGGAYTRDGAAQQAACYRRLGEKVDEQLPPPADRRPLLRDVWRALAKLPRLHDYLSAADFWIEYALRHFVTDELDALLGDITSRIGALGSGSATAAAVSAVMSFEEQTALASLLQRVLMRADNLGAVLQLSHFIPLLDSFPPGPPRDDLLRRAVSSLTSPTSPPLSDAVTIHFAFESCKALANGVMDPMSSEGDRREAGRITCRMLHLVRFGRDLEAHLEFLVSCRAAFSSLPLVHEQCCHVALSLATTTLASRQAAGGQHTSRTGAFAKACLAYAQVTIPSQPAGPRRVGLYLCAAQNALVHGFLPHADAYLRCAISDLADAATGAPGMSWFSLADGQADASNSAAPASGGPLTPVQDEELAQLVRSIAATLVVTPGHPERGALHHVTSLLRTVASHPWGPISVWDAQPRALCGILHALGALRQGKLPYHLPSVESNDVLYAGDDGYAQELDELAVACAQQAVAAVDSGGDGPADKRRASRRLDVACSLLACFKASGAELRAAVDALVTAAADALPPGDATLKAVVVHAKTAFKRAKAEAKTAGG